MGIGEGNTLGRCLEMFVRDGREAGVLEDSSRWMFWLTHLLIVRDTFQAPTIPLREWRQEHSLQCHDVYHTPCLSLSCPVSCPPSSLISLAPCVCVLLFCSLPPHHHLFRHQAYIWQTYIHPGKMLTYIKYFLKVKTLKCSHTPKWQRPCQSFLPSRRENMILDSQACWMGQRNFSCIQTSQRVRPLQCESSCVFPLATWANIIHHHCTWYIPQFLRCVYRSSDALPPTSCRIMSYMNSLQPFWVTSWNRVERMEN